MYCLHFLVLLLPCIFITNASSVPFNTTNDAALTASPASVHPGFTDDLLITCSFTHSQTSDFSILNSIILSKSSSTQPGVFTQLASITSASQSKVNIQSDLGSSEVKGDLVSNGVSFISFRWRDPQRDVLGRYKCQAYGMDFSGRPRVSTANLTVADNAFDIDSILAEMKKIKLEHEKKLNLLAISLGWTKDPWKQSFKAATFYNDHAYFLSNQLDLGVDITKAQSVCLEYGGYLAEINTAAEFKAVDTFLMNNKPSTGRTQDIYIGSKFNFGDKQWHYMRSGIMDRTLFNGLPSTVTSNTRSCLVIHQYEVAGDFYADNCDDKYLNDSNHRHYFLCEMDADNIFVG